MDLQLLHLLELIDDLDLENLARTLLETKNAKKESEGFDIILS